MELLTPSSNQVAAHKAPHIEILELPPLGWTDLDCSRTPQHTHSLTWSLAHLRAFSSPEPRESLL